MLFLVPGYKGANRRHGADSTRAAALTSPGQSKSFTLLMQILPTQSQYFYSALVVPFRRDQSKLPPVQAK